MVGRLFVLILLLACILIDRWPVANSITTGPKKEDTKNVSSLVSFAETGEEEDEGRRLGSGGRGCSRRIAEAAAAVLGSKQAGRWRGLDLSGVAVKAPLRSAPYDMYVTDVRLRSPSRPQHSALWLRVDRCTYDPSAHALQATLLFTDFAVTGSIKLFDDQSSLLNNRRPPALDYQDESSVSSNTYKVGNNINSHFGHQFSHTAPSNRRYDYGEAAVGCNMTLRMKKAGLGFTVVPTSKPPPPNRRRPPELRIATSTTFLEPQFISVHAYGCKSPEVKRWDGEEPTSEDDSTEARLQVTREMEEVFLRGVRSLLTKFIEAKLEPALRDALMLNLGYSLSYGKR